MADFVVLLMIALIVGAAIFYIVKEKKKGSHCIGCPDATTCPHAHDGQCGGF